MKSILALLLLLLVRLSLSQTPTPSLAQLNCNPALALRYRSFGNTGGDEVFMGVGDLGLPASRAAQNKVWQSPGSYWFNWTYDVTSDSLNSTVSGSPTLIYSDVILHLQQHTTCNSSSSIVSAVFNIVNRDVDTTVNLNRLFLRVGGGPLQNLSSAAYIGLTGFNEFPVLPIPQAYSTGFTFSGEFFINGSFGGSQELSRLDFVTCCSLAITPTPSGTLPSPSFSSFQCTRTQQVTKRRNSSVSDKQFDITKTKSIDFL